MFMILFILSALLVAAFFVHRAAREGRLDWRGVFRRASTILGLLTLAQGGAILGYSNAPPEWQAMLPPYVGGYMLVGMMLCGAMTAVATSIQQRWLAVKK